MSWHLSVGVLRKRFRPSQLSRFAFLAGAGISVPSGLPTAWTFNKTLASFLSETAASQEKLEQLLTTGYAASYGPRLRFEQVIQVLRDRDPELSILRVFDETGGPTFLHHFLARALSHGAAVFTTNFDSLIERAYYQRVSPKQASRLNQVFSETYDEQVRRDRCHSFAKYIRLRYPKPAVLKLHGSLRVTPSPNPFGLPRWDFDGLASIGATLDKVGRTSPDLRLEPHKEETLVKLMRGRVLCVMGYSGADDFDVTPSLASAMQNSAGLIWIRHEEGNTRVIGGCSSRALSLLPPVLRAACTTDRTVIICGRTARIVEDLFGNIAVSPGTPGQFNIRPVATVLNGYGPYAIMNRATRYLLNARLREEAKEFSQAKRLNQKILTFGPHGSDEEMAYALYRLGAIDRTQCRIAAALRHLRQAIRHAPRDTRLEGQILNVTGTVYMDKGELALARGLFRRAQKTAKRAHDTKLQSAVLTNLGLVERKLSHFQRALRYHTSALRLSTASRNREAMARDYGNIGTVYLRLGKYADALDVYGHAVRLARILGSRETLATVLMNGAIVLKHLRRFRQAERQALEGLKLEKTMYRIEGIARYWSLVAGLAYERRRYREGARMLRKAIQLQEPLRRQEGLADDWCSLGDCLKKLHLSTAAKAAYQTSSRYFHNIGNAKAVRVVLGKLRDIED